MNEFNDANSKENKSTNKEEFDKVFLVKCEDYSGENVKNAFAELFTMI